MMSLERELFLGPGIVAAREVRAVDSRRGVTITGVFYVT